MTTPPSISGFRDLHPIRQRGACSLWSAVEVDSGQARTLVIADAGCGAMLDACAHAHAHIRSPYVPRVDRRVREGGVEVLSLRCGAVADLEQVAETLSSLGERAEFLAGAALVDVLVDALAAAHDAGPYCLGALAWSNVLFDAQGRIHIIGFGANFPVRDRTGALLVAPGLAQAPEVTLGAPPLPASDVYVLHAFVGGMLPFVQMPPEFDRAIARIGQSGRDEVPLAQAVAELTARCLSPDPRSRPRSVGELREAYNNIGGAYACPRGDLEVLRKVAHDLLRRPRPSGAPTDRAPLVIDAEGRRVQLPSGVRVDLANRRALRLILCELVARSRSHRALSIAEVQAAGWPGERMSRDAGRSRAYVALSTLRKIGFAEVIRRREDGYVLCETLPVEVREPI